MEIQVLKKDGRLQPFDHNKISAGLIKSGVALEPAQAIATKVEEWAETAAQNGIVNSMEIRNKVLEILRSDDPKAVESFETYQKAQPVTV